MFSLTVFHVRMHKNNSWTCFPTEHIYQSMHANYDELGVKDGFVSYDEIKRALGPTTEEEWKKEIEPHDDGDKLLDPTGLTSELYKYWNANNDL